MFDANYRGRQAIIELAGAPLAARIAEVAAERSLSLDNPRKVYKFPTGEAPRTETILWPCVEVMPPSGDLEAHGSSIGSVLDYWVLFNVSTADPEKADRQLEAYLTALVRTYGLIEYGDLSLEVVQIDTSPPLSTTGGTVQAVGVLVRVTASE